MCVADGTCSTSKRVRYLNDLAKVSQQVAASLKVVDIELRLQFMVGLVGLGGQKQKSSCTISKYLMHQTGTFSSVRDITSSSLSILKLAIQ